MDLTAHYVSDARREVAAVEAVDITNPDLPRVDLVRLVTRLTETLRTTTDHTERLGQTITRLRAENTELENQLGEMHAALAEQTAAA